MNDIQLSENFKLSEFTRSETARRRKINNDAPESVIENLRNLCQNVLQPLRDYVGEPITISSIAVHWSTAMWEAARTHSTSSVRQLISACLSLLSSGMTESVTPTWM